MNRPSVGERVAVVVSRHLLPHLTLMDFETASAVLLGWARAERLAESPMELLFFAEAIGPSRPTDPRWALPRRYASPTHVAIHKVASDVELHAQYPIGKHRVDFAVIGYGQRIAIEIDGKDFHQDVGAESERDAAIHDAGWLVMHFTGAEVWADPGKCMDQLTAVLSGEPIGA